MSKYAKPEDNEGVVLDKDEIFRFACCDCGLVHSMDVVREKAGKTGIAFKRENRNTAQLRRHNYGNLQQQGVGQYRMIRPVQLETYD